LAQFKEIDPKTGLQELTSEEIAATAKRKEKND
jgi:hypothetical protein